MFLTIFILSLALLAVGILGMSVQAYFSKKKTFPDPSVSANRAMRKRKIYCIKTEQLLLDKNYKLKSGEKDSACGRGHC